jgi:hypothetical protein
LIAPSHRQEIGQSGPGKRPDLAKQWLGYASTSRWWVTAAIKDGAAVLVNARRLIDAAELMQTCAGDHREERRHRRLFGCGQSERRWCVRSDFHCDACGQQAQLMVYEHDASGSDN